VTFARERQLEGVSAFDAAIVAGRTRIRPVLMTAAAMIAGMVPMAIGGPGEERAIGQDCVDFASVLNEYLSGLRDQTIVTRKAILPVMVIW
jgi:hypothetical protein